MKFKSLLYTDLKMNELVGNKVACPKFGHTVLSSDTLP